MSGSNISQIEERRKFSPGHQVVVLNFTKA